ncbi:hypothetical protein SERLADRAFT_361323 [Serpula lacrymans var. lacrymans S7.9]|uniref:cysteine synthase n=1 Tax=Serpula lacrymans var. lacrymans (strain S7.9) TaxID=578457 RepID=F8NV01_SERL9|nr:uncharacterized protein SERLADRAFT_361323 [Serpula lacrymans var. lacrymans S7.9]EGO25956.1 hypothetical protein SERLADRAFT_361323 [Serpula lacrymans var. lacrymans S7.9]
MHIGNTPLVRINSLSNALGVEILGKAEYLNPGGSAKDRVALRTIQDAEKQGLLYPNTGSRIFEGTVGSTGISIATIAKASSVIRPTSLAIIMPDDVAEEKVKALQALGADVQRVGPASIVDRKQVPALRFRSCPNFFVGTQETNILNYIEAASPEFVTITSDRVQGVDCAAQANGPRDEDPVTKPSVTAPRGFFVDQFENRSNFNAHYDGTGPEIWRQINGHIDAFVSGAGTGGTIAGVGRFLKSKKEDIKVVLADPEGSWIYNKVKFEVMYDHEEAEGTKRRDQVDTVVEGIGINSPRLSRNLQLGLPIIDDAFRITDAEAVAMSRYLVHHDGLFLGSSSACNLVACVKLVRELGWKDKQAVVTILCDSGSKHHSKFWNDDYLHDANIPIDMNIIGNLLTESV